LSIPGLPAIKGAASKSSSRVDFKVGSASKPFRQVAVLKGGPSSEREVSLRSGAAVAQGLCAAGYTVAEVDVTAARLDPLPAGTEAVFIALHGEFGEDGQVQSLLEQGRIPYTGSGPSASRVAFDKRLSKRVFQQAGIPTAPYEILGPTARRSLPLPLVVKPPRQGSTIGIHRVFNEAEWAPACADARRYDEEILAETFIDGRELTVGIVVDRALPVIEIEAPGGWYSYEVKYTKGATRHLVPAPLDAPTAQRCQALALDTFHALGCRSLARVDFRMDPDGQLYVLELNNIPGFTETSLLPEAAAAAGIAFAALCDRIMATATLEG
jgi:D-alanine-D-alanine ligase